MLRPSQTKKSVRLQSSDRFLGKTKRTSCDALKLWTRRAPYRLQCKQRARSRWEARRLAKQPPPFCFFAFEVAEKKGTMSDCFVSKNGSLYSPCNPTLLPPELCRSTEACMYGPCSCTGPASHFSEIRYLKKKKKKVV